MDRTDQALRRTCDEADVPGGSLAVLDRSGLEEWHVGDGAAVADRDVVVATPVVVAGAVVAVRGLVASARTN